LRPPGMEEYATKSNLIDPAACRVYKAAAKSKRRFRM
jgi:hypothetical protein